MFAARYKASQRYAVVYFMASAELGNKILRDDTKTLLILIEVLDFKQCNFCSVIFIIVGELN